MAISAFPFDNQDTTEANYSAFFRELQDSGVIGGFGDASLRVTADSTGMQIKIAPGAAILRGHCVISTAIETRAVTAASAQPRVDAVVARLDPAFDSITFMVLAGTPAASNPTPPTLQQMDTGLWDLLLGHVSVAAGAATIAAGNVSERRPWIGQRVGTWSADTRPLSPRRGRLGLNMTTSSWEWHNGTAWVALAPEVAWAAVTGKPTAFFPSAHTHAITDVVGLADAFAYRDSQIAGRALTNHQHYIGSILTNDGTEAYSTALQRTLDANAYDRADIRAAASSAQTQAAAAAAAVGGKANAWGGDLNTVRYAPGPDSGSYGRSVSGGGFFQCWMDDSLQFGRNTSSQRYKEDIEPHQIDPAAVLALQPVSYHRIGSTERYEYGLIAEEVYAAGVPEIVTWYAPLDTDEDGETAPGTPSTAPVIDGIRYDLLAVALLEVCKDQQAQIDELRNAIKEIG